MFACSKLKNTPSGDRTTNFKQDLLSVYYIDINFRKIHLNKLSFT